MTRVIGFGEISGGKLKLRNEETFKRELARLKGRVEVTVEKPKSKRSLAQNDYYWGVPVQFLVDYTGHSKEEIHKYIKHKFLAKHLSIFDEDVTVDGSTRELTKMEFMTLIAEIQRWAAETFGLVIPDPDQQEFV